MGNKKSRSGGGRTERVNEDEDYEEFDDYHRGNSQRVAQGETYGAFEDHQRAPGNIQAVAQDEWTTVWNEVCLYISNLQGPALQEWFRMGEDRQKLWMHQETELRIAERHNARAMPENQTRQARNVVEDPYRKDDTQPRRKTKTGRDSKALRGIKIHYCPHQCGKEPYTRREHVRRHHTTAHLDCFESHPEIERQRGAANSNGDDEEDDDQLLDPAPAHHFHATNAGLGSYSSAMLVQGAGQGGTPSMVISAETYYPFDGARQPDTYHSDGRHEALARPRFFDDGEEEILQIQQTHQLQQLQQPNYDAANPHANVTTSASFAPGYSSAFPNNSAPQQNPSDGTGEYPYSGYLGTGYPGSQGRYYR